MGKVFGLMADSVNFDKSRYICIIARCDHLELDWPSQKTIWTKASNADLRNVLRKILSYLKMPGLIETDKYIEQLIKANNTFLYRLVFDLLTRKERLVIVCMK